MKQQRQQFASVLVGGGPAGMAVLLSAQRDGRLRELLRQGLLIVERAATLGCGKIGSYAIASDSTGATFIDPLRNTSEPALREILNTAVAQRCHAAGDMPVPLADVGELMAKIGTAMQAIVDEFPQSEIRTSCTAESAAALPDGSWRVTLRDSAGRVRHVECRNLILATGASQPAGRLQGERIAAIPLQGRCGDRLVQSDEVLTPEGLQSVARRLEGKPDPRIAILGGSNSAMAVAHALLHRLPQLTFQQGAITLLHRRPLRVFYSSASEAIRDGYFDFGLDDICPVTNRVYRFAGMRLHSRELLMQLQSLGGRRSEPRMSTHLVQGADAEAERVIGCADLVIAAFGYRPNALPLFDGDRRRIRLHAESGPASALVDGGCRVLDAQTQPIPGVFAIGLAAGFRPPAIFGGEASFSGQVNGLWVWQHGVGSIIAEAALARAQRSLQFTAPQVSRQSEGAATWSIAS